MVTNVHTVKMWNAGTDTLQNTLFVFRCRVCGAPRRTSSKITGNFANFRNFSNFLFSKVYNYLFMLLDYFWICSFHYNFAVLKRAEWMMLCIGMNSAQLRSYKIILWYYIMDALN